MQKYWSQLNHIKAFNMGVRGGVKRIYIENI